MVGYDFFAPNGAVDIAHSIITVNGLSAQKVNINEDGEVLILDASTAKVTFENGKISVSRSIPEPATATLSLLALAGLAARRRR